MKRIYTLSLLIALGLGLLSSCSNKYYRTGKKFADAGNYEDAITNFEKSINEQPEFKKAYQERAKVYEKTGKISKAARDYEKLIVLDPKDEEFYYNAARLRYDLEDYEMALKLANKALNRNDKHMNSYYIKIDAQIELDQIDAALATAKKAIDKEAKPEGFLRRADIFYMLGQYKKAEKDYRQVINKNEDKLEAYIGLAKSLYEQGQFNQALGVCANTIGKNEKYKPAYLTRAKIYHKKIDYPNAIKDLSKSIMLDPDAEDVHEIILKRGDWYYEFNQHMNAINDYSRVIKEHPKNGVAYVKRAQAKEAITKYEEAIKDYQHILSMDWEHPEKEKYVQIAKEQLYELRREEDKPVIVIDNKEEEELEVEIQKGKEVAVIKGHIEDASDIDSLSINGKGLLVNNEKKNPAFESTIILKDKDHFTIRAKDVYGNITDNRYKILRTEVEPPEILLIAPYASDNNQIYLDTEDDNLYIEGTIMDESKIKSIKIENMNASYTPDKINPTFTGTVNIRNKDKIKITAVDKFDNKNEQTYIFNREGANISETNPMGKTWAIFIENSDYQNFASLKGPGKDVTLMKSALAQYQIHNIIHKKDMTKKQFQRFFSIQLRDLVKSNRVNSILIWYAGHGKHLNNTGYWVPVDAKRGDEFDYFNINTLKSSMQSYSDKVTHTLVVTDACESGPTFYQAMRSTPEVRDCGDWKATKFKSSQVFSSAGYELASDDSQFTRTFSNSLIHNPNMCIPIEKIVLKVSDAVTKKGNQKPQFGKISGLEDENGTFFFMKK